MFYFSKHRKIYYNNHTLNNIVVLAFSFRNPGFYRYWNKIFQNLCFQVFFHNIYKSFKLFYLLLSLPTIVLNWPFPTCYPSPRAFKKLEKIFLICFIDYNISRAYYYVNSRHNLLLLWLYNKYSENGSSLKCLYTWPFFTGLLNKNIPVFRLSHPLNKRGLFI